MLSMRLYSLFDRVRTKTLHRELFTEDYMHLFKHLRNKERVYFVEIYNRNKRDTFLNSVQNPQELHSD